MKTRKEALTSDDFSFQTPSDISPNSGFIPSMILGSLDSYFMSIFKAPVVVLNKPEKMRRDLFWGWISDSDESKIAWVK